MINQTSRQTHSTPYTRFERLFANPDKGKERKIKRKREKSLYRKRLRKEGIKNEKKRKENNIK
jgi:hypothetical protein